MREEANIVAEKQAKKKKRRQHQEKDVSWCCLSDRNSNHLNMLHFQLIDCSAVITQLYEIFAVYVKPESGVWFVPTFSTNDSLVFFVEQFPICKS
jgi:hypothetical protein